MMPWTLESDCTLTLSIFYKKIVFKKVEAEIVIFYLIRLRKLLNKGLSLTLKPRFLIRDTECKRGMMLCDKTLCKQVHDLEIKCS